MEICYRLVRSKKLLGDKHIYPAASLAHKKQAIWRLISQIAHKGTGYDREDVCRTI